MSTASKLMLDTNETASGSPHPLGVDPAQSLVSSASLLSRLGKGKELITN